MAKIYWRFILNVHSRKVDFFTSEIVKLLKTSEVIASEPYWKISGRYDFQIRQNIDFSNSEQLIFKILESSSCISTSWNCRLPLDFSYADYGISGTSNSNMRIQGIEWANFELITFNNRDKNESSGIISEV